MKEYVYFFLIKTCKSPKNIRYLIRHDYCYNTVTHFAGHGCIEYHSRSPPLFIVCAHDLWRSQPVITKVYGPLCFGGLDYSCTMSHIDNQLELIPDTFSLLSFMCVFAFLFLFYGNRKSAQIKQLFKLYSELRNGLSAVSIFGLFYPFYNWGFVLKYSYHP